MNSERIRAFALQNTQRLSWDSSFYDTLIINLRKSDKRLTTKPLRVSEVERIRERSIKRASHFIYLITHDIHGVERVAETIRLGKMNLAVHRLEG